MHDEIETAPRFLDLGEGVVDALEVGHVAIDDDLGAQLLGERYGTAAECIVLIGEGELGSLAGEKRAIPQAIERSLATPMMRPRLPAINGPGGQCPCSS